jgi:hypothetical protein
LPLSQPERDLTTLSRPQLHEPGLVLMFTVQQLRPTGRTEKSRTQAGPAFGSVVRLTT